MESIRAERSTVTFFDGLTVEGYRMPDGEFRVGLEGASLVLGYAANWLYRTLTRKDNKTLKTLQGLGFDAYTEQVTTSRPQGGTARVDTVSLDDFNRLIAYAVFDGKKAALALQLSLTRMALNDFFRDAFGEAPLSIDEKRSLFYQEYARTISPEDWRQMDREDILRLALLGDESQLQEGRWNEGYQEGED
jgi:hypothetical protein